MNRIGNTHPPAIRKDAIALLDGAVAELFDFGCLRASNRRWNVRGNFLYLMAQSIYRPNQIPHL